MKNGYFLWFAFIFFSAEQSFYFGQSTYQPMLDHPSEWHFTTCSSICMTDIYYTDGDTLDNIVPYKVLNGYHFISRTFWLRENEADRKVYMSYIDPIRGREEVLLYDFSLNVGDSVEMKNPVSPFPFDGGYYSLDSIKPITLIGGNNSRAYFFSPNATNSNSESPIWLEGIGSLSIINAPGGTADVNSVGKLSCHFDDGFLLYTQMDSLTNCSATFVTEVSERKKIFNRIFPTICHDFLTLDVDDQFLTFSIFDLSGKLVFDQEIPDTRFMDLRHLENGFYFVFLKGNHGDVILEKIVKN